jgi:hypothetical protein
LTPKQRRKLERVAASRKAESGLVERVRIVLLAGHRGRFRFLYTPLHASWVNQVEIWFAILARRVLKHGSFPTDLALGAAVIGFIGHWNRQEAHPFRWTFRGRFKRAA